MTGFREALIDLGALAHNVRTIREQVGTEHLVAVVKANAYGHGAADVARTAIEAGADYIGTADLAEALELREAGLSAPILCWLHAPGADFGPAVDGSIDLGVCSLEQLEDIALAAWRVDGIARVQLKLETGLSRNGIAPADWDAVFTRTAALASDGVVELVGIFSHLSNASDGDDRAAIALFERGLAAASAHGLSPRMLHIAATAAALRLPESRFNTVRIGIGLYGVSPFDGQDAAAIGLRPVMTLRGRIAAVRRVEAGAGVSYDYSYRTESATTLVLVPLGYADGVPRQASNLGPVVIGGRRFRVAGRIAMDQFVVDVGDADVSVGDEVVLFGDPATGAPDVTEWADAAATINYEIVTRIGARVPRHHRREG